MAVMNNEATCTCV